MKLFQYNDYIYYTDYEKERDRPSLGYIKGDLFSVAIDAGHSDEHVKEFYELLKEEGLPLPTYTILTHWHWDHTFGMHAVNGITIASKKTNEHLKDFISRMNPEMIKEFRNSDPSIAKEYEGNKTVIVKEADEIYEGKMTMNLGNTQIEIFESVSPHTDDCTLIYLPKEKVLFIGDGCCGTPPTWKCDKKKADEMIEVLKELDFEIAIGGHWEPLNKKEQLAFFFAF